jgi:FlaA1/EpsC-like NDP-sugar epimerase
MITMSGQVPDVDVPVVFTGLRPGEKLFEELLTEEEESTRRVDQKIFVADCPAPSPELVRHLDELARAAAGENGESIRSKLREVVPTYSGIPEGDDQTREASSVERARKTMLADAG